MQASEQETKKEHGSHWCCIHDGYSARTSLYSSQPGFLFPYALFFSVARSNLGMVTLRRAR
jgi:hypothetical protein